MTTYDSNGVVLVNGGSDVLQVWYGGSGPYTLTAKQEAALIAAGYGAYIT